MEQVRTSPATRSVVSRGLGIDASEGGSTVYGGGSDICRGAWRHKERK